MSENYIWITTNTSSQTGARSNSSQANQNPYDLSRSVDPPLNSSESSQPISVTKLEKGMSDFLQALGQVIDSAKERANSLGQTKLSEVEISVEINSEGKFSLLGSGAKVGGSGAMTLRFTIK